MVMPVLKVDILRCIVDFALEACVVPSDEPATQLEKQGCLANLILVSKAGPSSYCIGKQWLTSRLSRRYVSLSCTRTVLSAMSTSFYTDLKRISTPKNRNCSPMSRLSKSTFPPTEAMHPTGIYCSGRLVGRISVVQERSCPVSPPNSPISPLSIISKTKSPDIDSNKVHELGLVSFSL